MVINKTMAVDVSIHAVSPVSSLGASAANAGTAVAARTAMAAALRSKIEIKFFISLPS